MARNASAEFTDYQVLTMIKKNPEASMRGLLRACKHDMPKWVWTIGKIQKSVERLEAKGKIHVDREVQKIEITVCKISEVQ